MNRARAIGRAVVLFSTLIAPTTLIASAEFHEYQPLWSFDFIGEEDPGGQELRGGRIGLGQWTDSAEIFGIRHVVSLSYASGDGQRLVRAEGNAGVIMLIAGPFRAAPTFGAGFEYRGMGPDDGVAGLLSIGFEAAFWLHSKWQVAGAIQRNFGFPSGTRNELSFSVRFAPDRFPWQK